VESLKPILLLIVLSGIGYLVYVALNRAPPSEPVLDAAPAWNQPVKIDAGPTPSQAGPRPSAPLGTDSLVTPPPSADAPRGGSTKSSLPLGAGTGANNLVTAPPSNPPPSNSSAILSPPPAPSSPPAMPPLINSAEPPQSSLTGASPASPPQNLAVDLELARQKHEFESAMRRAQADIGQNKLVEALRELSPWYDHTAVPAEQKMELDDLLSQLAGTVIYSRDHWLQGAHVVQSGETLETIAQRQQVPWQLLGKINGIDNPNSLVAGEQLKVIRGPFHAQLNRTHNQLALFVDGFYAGRFDVQTAGDVAQVDGTFPVTKFAADHPSNSLRQPYISLGGNLFLRLTDGAAPPQPGTMQIGARDLNDVFDILSDRSQVTIRR
jgi:hypothetical protein